jgi:hypothetical protein
MVGGEEELMAKRPQEAACVVYTEAMAGHLLLGLRPADLVEEGCSSPKTSANCRRVVARLWKVGVLELYLFPVCWDMDAV